MTSHYSDSQKSAIDKLSKVKCGALFMEAGTGKTRANMELIRSANPDYVLWLTPCATKDNLRQEIKKSGGLECDIIGIETIQQSDRGYLNIREKISKKKKAFMVVDESLKIKNSSAKRAKRVLDLAQFSEYRMILNGTPLSKNLLDLWSQMDFLSSKILNMGENEFKDTFCEYVQVTYHSQGYKESATKEFIKKYHNLDHLYKLIQPFIFESKLSLSVGVQHIDIPFMLSEEEKENHGAIKKKYLSNEWMLAKNNNLFLEITQKMQHNYSLSPAKFAIVDKLLEGEDNRDFIIFAKYVDTQKELKKRYEGIKVLSFQKHAYGLNLQKYSKIIFWDKTWDYAQREQAERRVYRTGQKNDCLFYDLTGDVGLEKKINLCIEKKRSLLDILSKKSNEGLLEL